MRLMDERLLAERLITYDTSTADGLRAAAGFVKGWLEARDIEVARPRPRRPAGRARRRRCGRRPTRRPSSSTATSTSSPAARGSSSRASRATA